MEIIEILNKIENILKNEEEDLTKSKESSEEIKTKNYAKEIFLLVSQFIVSILKTPFNLIANFLKNEIVSSIKNDAKLYAVIMGIMGVMFVFFSVLWLFISVAIGVYYFEQGRSILASISYSIVFQVISFLVVAFIAFIASTKIKSLKLLKNI